MTYLELERDNAEFRQILLDALEDKKGNWIGASDWTERAAKLLAPKVEPVKDIWVGKRWEGEKCATCGHSSTFHARGGICTKCSCDCDKFQSSGKSVETTT